MNEKTELRRHFRNIRDAISPDKRKAASAVICEKALALTKTLSARSVFVYYSMGSEVETHALTDVLCRQGICVSVPRCNTVLHTMDAVRLTGEWETDAYGILTPRGGEVISPSALDLILVPALAFDQDGYRLGYGGGYYDRYLKPLTTPTAGLCFSACLTDVLPRGVFDCSVGIVLTEER
ncbi:MAG: 5-formyltetrahydrofolate cyclo-ligase [Clostridia bacterium]|nr:5-formyltetrahydrofolate cyclo-ligase [Clostridia bacterium]